MIDEKKLIEELRKYVDELGTVRGEIELANGVLKAIPIVKNQPKTDQWISVEERLPEEHDSMFAKLKGTDKWLSGMFEKRSDEVIVTCEYGDGTRVTNTSRTIDGKWSIETKSIVKLKVLFWQPLPEPYRVPLE